MKVSVLVEVTVAVLIDVAVGGTCVFVLVSVAVDVTVDVFVAVLVEVAVGAVTVIVKVSVDWIPQAFV